MIRRVLTLLALAGVAGGFFLAVRDIYRIADRACGEAEAGGNCRSLANSFAHNDMLIFGFFAVLLTLLILLPHSKSTDR